MSGMVPIDRIFSGMRPIGFDDIYNTLDNFFSEPWAQIKNNTFKLDVEEKELVEAELPGIKKEEINV